MRLTAAATALVALTLSACTYENANCTPTRTTARRAGKVDVSVASRSAVIEARLTARGDGLAGRSLTFEVLDDDSSVYTAAAKTGSDGTARVDLKRADPDALLAVVRADAFRATFDGDGTYCSSSGRAGFHAVRS